MEKKSPEKREASPGHCRTLLRGCPAHFLLTAAAGIIGGLLVAIFFEFPSDGLWAAAYWSSSVYGFWIFTTSLIVLWSSKRYVACFGSGLYILFMFLVTTVCMSLRLFYRGGTPYETLFDMILHSLPGWLWYSIPPALFGTGLAAVLWGGRKAGTIGAVLRWMPLAFLCLETGWLFFYHAKHKTVPGADRSFMHRRIFRSDPASDIDEKKRRRQMLKRELLPYRSLLLPG